MRRRELVKALLGLAAAPMLLPLGVQTVNAQDSEPMRPGGAAEPAPPASSPPAPAAPSSVPPVQPLPTVMAQGPIPNNIVGLNVARLHQPVYIWATSDAVNANGGDWGYITVVWTIADREDRNAEYNLQQFLDRCFEHHVQPIVRVGTTFTRSTRPGNQPPGSQGADGSWSRPEWDEPEKWRAFFERATWPTRHAWIIVGNEPNLGREWGGAVDAAGYARYLAHFLDVFESAPRFDVVSGALDISNNSQLPVMQDALEFLDQMAQTVPGIFERLPAWASNPYRVVSGGSAARYTHRAYEAEFDRIGREMPVLITEAGHLETGDEQEIARFYAEAFRDWMADPKVVAATPLFWHPDRNDFWMFELDKRGAFIYKSPTYDLLRRLPRVAGSPEFAVTIGNTARTTPFEATAEADAPDAPPRDDAVSTAVRPATGERVGDTGEHEDAAHAGSPPPRPTASQTAAAEPPVSAGTSPAGQTPANTSGSGANGRTAGIGALSLRVTNTDGAGARLRAAPSTAAEAIAVLPDGAIVQALGPARQADQLSWQRVRAPDGAEGWIASELLAPTEPGE